MSNLLMVTTHPGNAELGSASTLWNDAVADGERGRLDRSRRRPADEMAALALAHHTVSGICHTICSARRRTERPGRSRSPFPNAWLRQSRQVPCNDSKIGHLFLPIDPHVVDRHR